MKRRSAIKTDLFAAETRREKLDRLGDPLAEIGTHIGFGALAAAVDAVAPRPVSPQGGRPPFPTETMVRILGTFKGSVTNENRYWELLRGR